MKAVFFFVCFFSSAELDAKFVSMLVFANLTSIFNLFNVC